MKTKEKKILEPGEMLKHEISLGRVSEFKFKFLKGHLGEALTSGRALPKGEPSKIHIHPITVVHSVIRPTIIAAAVLRGADKKTIRKIEKKYRTFDEVLAHELYHHIEPYASERDVIAKTEKFLKSPTKRVFRKRRKSRAEKIKTNKK